MHCHIIGIALSLVLATPSFLRAVQVYESPLSTNAVCIHLDANEVASAQGDRLAAQALGVEVASQMILLAGVPESISGKVAAIPVWETLCIKYGSDIRKYTKSVPEGNSLTLKYRGVDLKGVRWVWQASSLGDPLVPGSELNRAVLKSINTLLNTFLD